MRAAVSAQAIILYDELENYTFQLTATSPRVQWVNGPYITGTGLSLRDTEYKISHLYTKQFWKKKQKKNKLNCHLKTQFQICFMISQMI